MDEFFDNKRAPESFAGQGFSIELIRRYGIRTAELGNYSMEYDLKTPEQKAEVCNVVRFAINRSQLTQEHMDYVIAAVKALYEDRESIPNVRIVKGHDLPMRPFPRLPRNLSERVIKITTAPAAPVRFFYQVHGEVQRSQAVPRLRQTPQR